MHQIALLSQLANKRLYYALCYPISLLTASFTLYSEIFLLLLPELKLSKYLFYCCI